MAERMDDPEDMDKVMDVNEFLNDEDKEFDLPSLKRMMVTAIEYLVESSKCPPRIKKQLSAPHMQVNDIDSPEANQATGVSPAPKLSMFKKFKKRLSAPLMKRPTLPDLTELDQAEYRPAKAEQSNEDAEIRVIRKQMTKLLPFADSETADVPAGITPPPPSPLYTGEAAGQTLEEKKEKKRSFWGKKVKKRCSQI